MKGNFNPKTKRRERYFMQLITRVINLIMM